MKNEVKVSWAGRTTRSASIFTSIQSAAATLGSIKTKSKAEAARANGKLGGRPRKVKP